MRLTLSLLLVIITYPEAVATDFLITAYGAKPDSTHLNTVAIQQTLDAAYHAGGGRVVIPKGTFLSGSIYLRQNVELHLAEGAVLLGSDHLADYPTELTRIEGQFVKWPIALVNASGLTNLRITGPGRLDGNGLTHWRSFWRRRAENPACTNLEIPRPRLVHVVDCRHVIISNLSFHNSAFWNLHLYRCRDVLLEGLEFFAPGTEAVSVRAASSDGIDIDSSQDVVVRHCTFAVDDDCIALKGTKGPLAGQDASSPPVENILVEKCIFTKGLGVLTCGSEATLVRNVTVRDCDIHGRINIVRLKLRPDTPQRYENMLFENLCLSGDGRLFDVKPWTQFFDLQGHPAPTSFVTDITVRNITGTYGSLGRIVGNPLDDIRNIHLENIQLMLTDPSFERGSVNGFTLKKVSLIFSSMEVGKPTHTR